VAEIKKLVDKELGYIVEGSLSSHYKVGKWLLTLLTVYCF